MRATLGELSAKARAGKLTAAEMQGAGFTISSLGGIGGTAFTPIINAPEVAILGVSRSQHAAGLEGREVRAAPHAAALARPTTIASSTARPACASSRSSPLALAGAARPHRGRAVSEIGDSAFPISAISSDVEVIEVLVKPGDASSSTPR